MKKVLKIVGKIILGIIIFVLIFYVAFVANELRKSYQWQKSVDNFEQAMREPYEKDIYGGSTPEQTWELFLTALRNEDIELASKYYTVSGQWKAKELLEKLKTNNLLEQKAKEMEGLKKVKWDKENKWHDNIEDRKYYFYDSYSDEFKEYFSARVDFALNPLTKVWKIVY